MTSLIVVGLLFASLSILNYVTKRRFGVLGLALAAGALLSANWAHTLTPFMQERGITLVTPPLGAVVAMCLILLPPLIVLFSGPTYNKRLIRMVGALGFGLLAITLLTPSLATALQLNGPGQVVLETLDRYKGLIIVVGLVFALADVVLTKTPKEKEKK